MFSEAGRTLERPGQGRLDEAFWLSHMRVGFGVFIAESLAVAAYMRATPNGASRGLLIGVAIASAVFGGLSYLVLRAIARQTWRARFSLFWSLGAGWVIAWMVHLDGGLDSPMLYIVIFPVIYAALGYRPVAVVTCGLAALAQLAVISGTDDNITLPRANLFLIAAVIGGMSALAVAASVYRAKLHRSEALLRRELAALADTDGLTGCLNHRAFHEHLAVEIERALRYRRPLSLIVVDIDNFKSVNDTYGHPAGDEALVAVAGALRGELRSADVVGRVGGDEFGVILSDTPVDGAETHARRISRALDLDGEQVVALSIGIAELDPANPSAAQLLRDADRALYHVKGTGRHGIAATTGGTLVRLAG
jgi:diguanylate cyclase (GGDEF)-like protein